ncbi:MAG: hypothetical protein IT378_11400 [Sandaracinaceae bacterium]|nr:hypothetical protein [Sandaracinaceae bacterium]
MSRSHPPPPPDRAEPSLKERLEELVKELLGSLESLIQPEPALVPVPVRGGRRPRPR